MFEYFKNQKIVSIQPSQRARHFPSIGRVEAYWEGLRDTRLMPTRADIDPRGIADALEYAFVLEKIAPGLARFRLAGMHLNDLMGMEVRGMPLSALFLPDARAELHDTLVEVLDGPAIVRLALTSDRGYGRPALDAQMILMPLRDDEGRPARVLGAVQARGEIGTGPRRLRIRDVETKPLVCDPARNPRCHPIYRGLADQGMAPAPARARRQRGAAAPGKAPHLSLVYDADVS